MNRTRLALWWLASSIAVAAATAWAVLRWHVAHEHPADPNPTHAAPLLDSEERFHEWVHRHLNLTDSQQSALEAREAAFADRRRELRQDMRRAGDSLCAAIARDQANSPSVQASLEALAAAQAALQKATLAHLFEMAAALEPPDRQKLIQWTHDSLQPTPQ
jgi:Spy/CpxP family protein refolding chaperone